VLLRRIREGLRIPDMRARVIGRW